MLGNRRIRIAASIAGVAGLLAIVGLLGPSANAEIATVSGEAYGIAGEITVPNPDPLEDPITEVIEPRPAVTLPANGQGDQIEDTELNFDVEDDLVIQGMTVGSEGSLPSGGNRGGTFSDTLVDNLFLIQDPEDLEFGYLIHADALRSSCVHDGPRSVAGVDFEDLVIAGVDIEEQPAPNTVIELPDGLGEVRLNVQEEGPGRIAVTAMEIEYDFEDPEDPREGSLRLGFAECGITEVVEENNQVVIPDSDIADAFEGDPEFTG
jgi:hypothetical protein